MFIDFSNGCLRDVSRNCTKKTGTSGVVVSDNRRNGSFLHSFVAIAPHTLSKHLICYTVGTNAAQLGEPSHTSTSAK